MRLSLLRPTGSECGLRDYGVNGQLGLEKTPEEYVQKMVQVFREIWRVLRDDGTLWLNMGDSYASIGRSERKESPGVGAKQAMGSVARDIHWQPGGGHNFSWSIPSFGTFIKPKNLCGIPWHLAFALQADGWYLRSDIIWAKPNPMPESVSGCAWERHRIKVNGGKRGMELQRVGSNPTRPQQDHDGKNFSPSADWQDCPGCPKCIPNDGLVLSWNAGRPTKSHEYIFLLTKSPKYFFDQEAVREGFAPKTIADIEGGYGWTDKGKNLDYAGKIHGSGGICDPMKKRYELMSPNGRNLRTVWTISTQSFPGAHFATFPEELARRCILAGTSEKGCCPKCGAQRVRIIKPSEKYASHLGKAMHDHIDDSIKGMRVDKKINSEYKTIGWRPSCKCFGDEWNIQNSKSCVVFDPFFGSGTVGVVCQKFNRRFIGLDLKMDYCKMARKRLSETNRAMI